MPNYFKKVKDNFAEIYKYCKEISHDTYGEEVDNNFSPAGLNLVCNLIKMIENESGVSIRNSIIIDAGCGVGQISIFFALLGAKLVYAVDVDELRIDVLKKIIEGKRKEIPELRNIETFFGDILEFIPNKKANLIFCNEMLSHLWDRAEFYQKMSNILAYQGKLIASDTNNGANQRIVEKRRQEWRNSEKPGGRIYELRKKFIMDNLAIENIDTLNYVTLHTCYLRPDGIIKKAQDMNSGFYDASNIFQDNRAPYDPEYYFLPSEDLLYPDEEIIMIKDAGMQPKIVPYFMGVKRGYLVWINRCLKYVPISLSRGLHIIATKL